MKNQKIEKVVNPFIRIAGTQALLWGALGLVVSTLLSWLSGYHYHGLLHFGPAPNPAWWCSITDDRNESDLFITPYASDRTSRFYNGTY